MKYLKKFESDNFDDIYLDVGQMLELLSFKYGKDKFKDSYEQYNEDESDFDPDYIFETIKYELEQENLYIDFIKNWKVYLNEMEENDPLHWKYRQKQNKKFTDSWD